MKLGQYLGYGAGDAANNLTFSTVSAFLLIYYTNVAGITAAAAPEGAPAAGERHSAALTTSSPSTISRGSGERAT